MLLLKDKNYDKLIIVINWNNYKRVREKHLKIFFFLTN